MNVSIKKVLIANQGEVVIRICRTLKKKGIRSVGLYLSSQVNDHYLHACDESAMLEGDDLQAYLGMDQIIELAKKHECDAIHPGYGFLSENAEFAKACEYAGLVFIGPSARCLAMLGDKSSAKDLAKNAKIPVLQNLAHIDLNEKHLTQVAQKMGFPLLLKPVMGGGGKGMLVVERQEDLLTLLRQAKATARSSFGNETVLIEPYIRNAKHVEIQVVMDQYGKGVHIFERDCSAQRRHQKIIEESESSIPDSMIKSMQRDALTLAKKIKYDNIGTVEFIIDLDRKKYFFMEVNPRLQVEHSVTEHCTQLDLVKIQIEICEGKSLKEILPSKIIKNGYAIEVRIYAEDAEQGFLPASGTILHLHVPQGKENIQIDSNLRKGQKVSFLFDPMMMKVTLSAATRAEGIENLKRFLHEIVLFGVKSNVSFYLVVGNP
ncbi:MAG: biotin carboxylase N-terminal domain-containing protein [Bdellovibrionota bacterium]